MTARRRRSLVIGSSLAAVLAVLGGLWIAQAKSPTAAGNVGASSGPSLGAVAPMGTYTNLDGVSTQLASVIQGRRAMIWFVADGCASCAASIPAVGAHLATFRSTGTEVVVLGIYGAFGSGPQAISTLAGFASDAAGAAFTEAGWTWGLASEGLSAAYDPGGVPDEYFLVDATGHVTYESSVPVSTMGSLLAHLNSPRSGT